MFSLYKQDDDRLPINWATAVFASEELALQAKRITEERSDIKEVFVQENNIQTQAWERRPTQRAATWRARVASEIA